MSLDKLTYRKFNFGTGKRDSVQFLEYPV